jgi:FG-GAP-like repeat/Secretion system C-terminal sorting domain/IPT/TIG domain
MHSGMKNFYCILLSTFFYTVSAAQPVISSFSPLNGQVGSTVTITGTGFGVNPTDNIVYFGASKATVLTASTGSVSVTVPYGATFQPLSITVNNLTGYSKLPFIITFNAASTDFTATTFDTRYDLINSANQGCALGDFDIDGKSDLTATSSSFVSISKNSSTTAALSFTPAGTFTTGNESYPYEHAVNDYDGDGLLDVAVAKSPGVSFAFIYGQLSVFRNTSAGGVISFSPRIDLLANDPETSWYGIASADFDSDGKPDIIITNNNGVTGRIAIFRNTSTPGNLSFAPAIKYTSGLSPRLASAGDIDNDGKPDIVVANQGSNSISIFRNLCTPGTISFSGKIDFGTRPGSLFLEDARLADLNLDGKLDIAITDHFYPSPGTVSVFQNNSTPGNISLVARVDYITTADPWAISCNDFNGDGKPDFAVTNNFSSTFTLYKNNSTPGGSISLLPQATYTLPGVVRGIMSADMNDDGKPEIITQHVLSSAYAFGIHTNNMALVTLPLTLLNFTGKPDGNNAVALKWTTTNENGVESFTIERSKNGVSFAAIGNVATTQLPTTVKEYLFTDVTAVIGVNYYRLKINDNNGSSKFSNIIPVRLAGQFELTLHPDPVTDILQIKMPLQSDSHVEVNIFDITGKKMKTMVIRGSNTTINLPVADLPSGSYVLSLQTSKRVITKKFIRL